MFDYSYFSRIGFWFVIGSAQAIAVLYVITCVINLLYEAVANRLSGVRKFTFINLPDHIQSMHLSYNKKHKIITAIAVMKDKREAFSTHVTGEDIKPFAEYVQLELMNKIAKENKGEIT